MDAGGWLTVYHSMQDKARIDLISLPKTLGK